MKESHREGVAGHPGPELCGRSREAASEALDRGISRLGIELRNRMVPGADGVTPHGRQHEGARYRESSIALAESETPRHAEKLHAREPGDPNRAREQMAGRPEKPKRSKSGMHAVGESYSGIVPAKQPNKGGQPSAEVVEGRTLAKENTDQHNPQRTLSRISGQSGLERVREAARRNGRMKFTALLHHITPEALRQSYYSLKKQAAPGVDGQTWADYGGDLEVRLNDLHGRIHRGAYHARPSRRVWIPKTDGRQRPLGIAALEDKIVQYALVTVLNQIWEEDFLGFSYGFRPGRNQHEALDALWVGIMRKKVNWVLDLDIRGFYDNVRHEWMIKFVEHRIQDKRVIRLIQKWLKAGVVEEGKWLKSEIGTPQGATISPLLANLYLHYALDIWVEQWRRKLARGDVIIVRYADDAVLGFQYREEAERFLVQVRDRLQKFGLELHPDKTRLIEFGRYATERRKGCAKGRPETFNFLGFTHICGTDHKGHFTVHRRTMSKRLAAKLANMQAELRKRRHMSVKETVQWLCAVVRGYFQYHAVPGNWAQLKAFRNEVSRLWLQQLRRRSQRHRWPWAKFQERLGHLLPEIQILHPYPDARFNARIQGRNRVR